MQIEISKGKKHVGQRPKEAGSSSQGLSPWTHTGHTDFPQQRDMTTHVKCCQPGTLVRDSVPEVFLGGWSHRQLQPFIYLNSLLLEGV